MKVTLIDYTQDAVEKLLFTKSTRLNMSPTLLDEIRAWPEDKKREELKYMAHTLPSSWEFVSYTFMIEGVTRAFTHQLVRTRSASYAQQAMRIVNMEGFGYLTPPDIAANKEALTIWVGTMLSIQKSYDALIKMGMKAEDARGLLPTNVLTNICVRHNLRSLSDLCKARLSGRVQEEYRGVVQGMMDAVLAVHPWASPFLQPHGPGAFDRLEAMAAEIKEKDKAKGDQLQKDIYHIRTGS